MNEYMNVLNLTGMFYQGYLRKMLILQVKFYKNKAVLPRNLVI